MKSVVGRWWDGGGGTVAVGQDPRLADAPGGRSLMSCCRSRVGSSAEALPHVDGKEAECDK